MSTTHSHTHSHPPPPTHKPPVPQERGTFHTFYKEGVLGNVVNPYRSVTPSIEAFIHLLPTYRQYIMVVYILSSFSGVNQSIVGLEFDSQPIECQQIQKTGTQLQPDFQNLM